jgi:hypothetical protein
LTNVSVAGISPTAYFTKLIGKDSYATGAVDVLNVLPASINGNAVNFFTTFSQLTSLVGSKQGATNFIADETVYGGDTAVVYTQSQAKFHSYLENGSDDIVYVTNVKNVFPLANSVTGDTSKAVLNISYKYDGWLVKDSGDVVYVENVDPITRASNKSETVKLILEF